jgi:hypothetical protein
LTLLKLRITNYELPFGFGSYSTRGDPKTVLPHELRIGIKRI